MQQFITGIQQVGIGVEDATEAKYLYRNLFGMDVLVFDDNASANLMAQYTGNEIHQRRAILSLNLQGGGGFEIWQFTSRKPTACITQTLIGDIGIFGVKIKTADIQKAHTHFRENKLVLTSPVFHSPDNRLHFWVKDYYGNIFNIIEGKSWFKLNNSFCGGVAGVTIGVTDMGKALDFYKNILGINNVVYDTTDTIVDGPDKDETNNLFRRVLLTKQQAVEGAFCKLLGCVEIELIEAKERVPNKIFANRFWGDCGFIHICFDVIDMNALKQHVIFHKHCFTVDSGESFSMGASAGRFCYIEDPDGTLIELVETHKVPVFKKMGVYFNLEKRKTKTPLPDWMVNLLRLNKIR